MLQASAESQKMINTAIYDAEDLDIVMPMHNLIE